MYILVSHLTHIINFWVSSLWFCNFDLNYEFKQNMYFWLQIPHKETVAHNLSSLPFLINQQANVYHAISRIWRIRGIQVKALHATEPGPKSSFHFHQIYFLSSKICSLTEKKLTISSGSSRSTMISWPVKDSFHSGHRRCKDKLVGGLGPSKITAVAPNRMVAWAFHLLYFMCAFNFKVEKKKNRKWSQLTLRRPGGKLKKEQKE